MSRLRELDLVNVLFLGAIVLFVFFATDAAHVVENYITTIYSSMTR